MTDLTNELAEQTDSHVDKAKTARRKPWQTWLDAELGFRDYWYPAALSTHVKEGEVKAVKLLGEDILLTRREGRLFAIEDRCCHRGVRFSKRPLFYTADTITCWYHTWTYDLQTGKLFTILVEPNSSLIGKCGIKSYPIEERKEIVFVFIGDIDPPPLEADLPPGFLDEDMAIAAVEPYDIESNWRLACENGYDPGHHFIHNWSKLCVDADLPIPFGWVTDREGVKKTTTYFEDEPGPQGFSRHITETAMPFEAEIPAMNGRPAIKVRPPLAEGKSNAELKRAIEGADHGVVGLWMPCGLKVDSWPYPDVWHVEFYVPRDAGTHTYFQFGCKKVSSEAEHSQWLEKGCHEMWEAIPKEFTQEDAFARRNMEKFYADEDGWQRERLFRPDIELTMWRKFASTHARAVQKPEHTKGLFQR